MYEGHFLDITRDNVQDQYRVTNRHGSIYAVDKLRTGDNSYIQLKWSCFGKQPSSQHERDTNERSHLPVKYRANTNIKCVTVIHIKLKIGCNIWCTFCLSCCYALGSILELTFQVMTVDGGG